MGGGWRQAGILAAAGLVALDKMIDRLHIDHEHALKIAKGKHSKINKWLKRKVVKLRK